MQIWPMLLLLLLLLLWLVGWLVNIRFVICLEEAMIDKGTLCYISILLNRGYNFHKFLRPPWVSKLETECRVTIGLQKADWRLVVFI